MLEVPNHRPGRSPYSG